MPTELRSLALGVIMLAALPALFSYVPVLVVLVIAALAIAALGLVPPMPPMINGLAAVLGGATIAAAAAASGHVGLVAIAAAPLAVGSLRLGWRPAVWSAAIALVILAVLAPPLMGLVVFASPVAAVAVLGIAIAWGGLHWCVGRTDIDSTLGLPGVAACATEA